MTKKEMLGAQVKQLLSSVSDHGSQHLGEVETDLVQTGVLLDEAIGKLGKSFMDIHAAVSAQQAMLDLLVSEGAFAPENTERLQVMSGEIGQHINAAVTGLQFQDMTSQLIDRTLKRVIGLRDMLAALGSSGSGMQAESGSEQIGMLLASINHALTIQSEELVLLKSVHQNHMECGDIELF